MRNLIPTFVAAIVFLASAVAPAGDVPRAEVEGQPLAAAAARLIDAFEYLGHPLPEPQLAELQAAIRAEDPAAIQSLLDPQVLLAVHINPELRVKVARGPAEARIVEGGFTPLLVKVLNEAVVTERLRVGSPQAGKSVRRRR